MDTTVVCSLLDVISLLLVRGAAINSQGTDGWLPAASDGHEEVVKVLLAHKDIDSNHKDDEDLTPAVDHAQWACQFCWLLMVWM